MGWGPVGGAAEGGSSAGCFGASQIGGCRGSSAPRQRWLIHCVGSRYAVEVWSEGPGGGDAQVGKSLAFISRHPRHGLALSFPRDLGRLVELRQRLRVELAPLEAGGAPRVQTTEGGNGVPLWLHTVRTSRTFCTFHTFCTDLPSAPPLHPIGGCRLSHGGACGHRRRTRRREIRGHTVAPCREELQWSEALMLKPKQHRTPKTTRGCRTGARRSTPSTRRCRDPRPCTRCCWRRVARCEWRAHGTPAAAAPNPAQGYMWKSTPGAGSGCRRRIARVARPEAQEAAADRALFRRLRGGLERSASAGCRQRRWLLLEAGEELASGRGARAAKRTGRGRDASDRWGSARPSSFGHRERQKHDREDAAMSLRGEVGETLEIKGLAHQVGWQRGAGVAQPAGARSLRRHVRRARPGRDGLRSSTAMGTGGRLSCHRPVLQGQTNRRVPAPEGIGTQRKSWLESNPPDLTPWPYQSPESSPEGVLAAHLPCAPTAPVTRNVSDSVVHCNLVGNSAPDGLIGVSMKTRDAPEHVAGVQIEDLLAASS